MELDSVELHQHSIVSLGAIQFQEWKYIVCINLEGYPDVVPLFLKISISDVKHVDNDFAMPSRNIIQVSHIR